jgi:hypothetical protein
VGPNRPGMPSIEALQLALLGVALVLVAARLRVRILRHRGRHGPRPAAQRAVPVPSQRAAPVPARHAGRDEWPFPDPSAPTPTGLLPSTASARRRARELAMSCDRR